MQQQSNGANKISDTSHLEPVDERHEEAPLKTILIPEAWDNRRVLRCTAHSDAPAQIGKTDMSENQQ